MKIKSALRGSEKTAPNILFKKLNIIYKSIFHKKLFPLYISTGKSFDKGDTSFSYTDPPAKIHSILSHDVTTVAGVEAALKPSQQSVGIKFGYIWFLSSQPISSLRRVISRGTRPPGPYELGWHRGDGNSLPTGLQLKMKAAAGWGIELHAFPFLPFSFQTPCTLSKLYHQIPIPWTYQEWVDEVFGYALSQ